METSGREFATDVLPVIAEILVDVCAVHDKRPVAVFSMFHAAARPQVPLHDYLQRIHAYSECSHTAIVMALIYVDRAQQNSYFNVNSLNVHRLLVTSCMLAAKFFDDTYVNNDYWARIAGVSNQEMNGSGDALARVCGGATTRCVWWKQPPPHTPNQRLAPQT